MSSSSSSLSPSSSSGSLNSAVASSQRCEFCDPQEVQGRLVYSDYRHWNVLSARSPVEEGHFIITPIRHVDTFEHLSPVEAMSYLEVLNKSSKVVAKLYRDGNKPFMSHRETDPTVAHFYEHFTPFSPELKKVALYNLLFDDALPPLSEARMAETVERSRGYYQEVMVESIILEQCEFLKYLLTQSPFMKFAVEWRLESLGPLVTEFPQLTEKFEALQQLAFTQEFVGSENPADHSGFHQKVIQIDQLIRSSVWTKEVAFVLHRDRYDFVTPYVYNQVALNDGTSMNASKIKFPEEREPYSCAPTFAYAFSAPTPNFIPQTLRMYAQENASYIVNLTEFQEVKNGVISPKADPYLPENVDDVIEGEGYRIKTIAKVETSLSDVLTLEEKVCEYEIDGQTRRITQFHVRGWLDFTPGDPSALAKVIKKLSAFEKENPGSGFVHCSAGVGRTGVIIGGKRILELVEQGNSPDIERIAVQMRSQRVFLGSSEGQYKTLWTLKEIFENKQESSSETTVSADSDIEE